MNGELTKPDPIDSPLDVCACGDYRKDHVDDVGACRHNKPGDMTHGFRDCESFRLSRRALHTERSGK